MKRFKFVFSKHFKLHPGIGLLALCLVLVSWLVLPVAAMGAASSSVMPPWLQQTLTPFWPASQNSGNRSPSASWQTISQSGHFQSLLSSSKTPRALINQSLSSTGLPYPLDQLLPTATANVPAQGVTAGVTGIKTVNPASAAIGEHLRFRISLTNTANDQAIDLEVIDDFPDFLTIVDVTTTQNRGTVDVTDNQVTVFFHSLDPNRTYNIDIDTIVNNLAIGSFFYENFATFTYFYINTQFPGQTNTVQYQITSGPPTPPPSGFPLASLKTVSGSPALQGDLLGFRIDIQNVGTAPADNLIITDVFPNFLTITNVTTTLGTVQINLNQVTVSINTLAVNQVVRIDIATFVNQDVPGIYTNTANFTYNYLAAPGAGATNAAIYQIGGQAPRLVAQKTVSGSPAGTGDALGFFIEIANVGNAPAYNIQVTDAFPNYLTITRVTTSKGTVHINQNTNTVVVNINTMLVDEVVRINISTVVNQGVTGTITDTNVAFITYYTFLGQSFVGNTNSAVFQIGSTTSGGLPPTGGIEKSTSISWITPASLVFGTVYLLLGVFILRYKPRRKFTRLFEQAWVRTMGIVLLVVGFCFTLVACAGGQFGLEQEQDSLTVASTQIPSAPANTSTLPPPVPTQPSASPTLSALPDYPIPTPAFLAGAGDNDITFDVSPIRRIVIASIDVDTIVKYVPFDGLSWKIAGLNTEVVWMGETSWPGLGSNTGLSAHVSLPDGSDGPFRRLFELKAGDLVELYTEENKYIYSVRSQEIVSESDLSVLLPTDQSQITLITCTDWNEAIQKYLNRLIVYSDLVDIQPLSTAMGMQ